ncbi:hypothetical protein GLOIN_2v1772806 [Rhizophagus irregularis DAOM 181602=DAOM 197198]|uniref:Myb/SANT-like DNA-binding domain-containing protein n=2 Tax=Rhizophagus irregularis (strain DAOM 181602 / DAOM 197198 / MUCL 43194) TaxID=747089 RepID=A0A2P4Q6C3_RHIID|nr:hypothetical protein GLOIN_2v1772806 [Rhizophagus irregularis DAOM 181602=DAOM 197198]POG73193.1 hypothetical protein GLOIN_2v1772806 [Rhizophagus irregularis DAOM 181602=DAOM 197198]|eukprot:XP_025180059.1 hypothetical protein GLOIN_2v1772806 [Rhizophagus irregularis DAOM 181602=DAOM 197198]
MDETIETIFSSNNYTNDFNQELNAHLQFQSLLDYSHHNQGCFTSTIHSLSQLEFDHPDHPTLNEYCHSQGLSVDVLPQEASYLDYNVDNPNQGLTESSEYVARKLSWSSSTLVCESPRQMTFSSESPTLVCESPMQTSFSSDSPTFVCESPRQMSFSSESPTFVCESPRQMSFSSESPLKKSRKLSSGKNTRCFWSDEAVECLLLYLEDNIDKIEKLGDPHSGVKLELWNGASELMLAEKHSYSWEQCCIKWKNIKRQYMNGILDKEKDPFQYTLVGKILGHTV